MSIEAARAAFEAEQNPILKERLARHIEDYEALQNGLDRAEEVGIERAMEDEPDLARKVTLKRAWDAQQSEAP